MSNRAPDGQPTTNIEIMLSNARKGLNYWEQCERAESRALARSQDMIDVSRETVAKLEAQLAIRLSEEAAAPQEVTGL